MYLPGQKKFCFYNYISIYLTVGTKFIDFFGGGEERKTQLHHNLLLELLHVNGCGYIFSRSN